MKHCSALTSVKGGTHTCYIDVSGIYAPARMSPAHNGSSALQRFKQGNAVERLNGLMFDFYKYLTTTNSTEMELVINLCPIYILALTIVCVLLLPWQQVYLQHRD